MSDVTQSNNTVQGDLVGGDLLKVVMYPPPVSNLRTLLQSLAAKSIDADAEQRYRARLGHYAQVQDKDEPKGLQSKLVAGGHEVWLREALRNKDLFSKRLAESNLGGTGPAIYEHVMALILSRFNAQVAPLVRDHADERELRTVMLSEIVEPICAELGSTELDLTSIEVEGIVWYLTGNCFINWV